MLNLPNLYKKDSKGNTRIWNVKVEDDEVIVTHGLEGGSLIENRTRCVPKNVGRANATTAQEQALAEAQSKWNKQRDRERYSMDYTLDVDTNDAIAPMLARDYTKVGHQLDWSAPVYVQPKLDGNRVTYDVRTGTLWSRKGTEITVPSHITEQLRTVGINTPLDGELSVSYTHLTLPTILLV